MSRMDRYSELNEVENTEIPRLSRIDKNQRMYEDAYLNTSLVDINSIIEPEETVEVSYQETASKMEVTYEPKSYDINEYLEKAHEKISPDDALRDINNNEFKEQEDEIRKLIASIDEKEEEEDFFSDLKGDNDDTMIGAKFKTDEFDTNIYETLKKEDLLDGNTILDHALSDKTVIGLEEDEEEKLDHTFEEIIKEDTKSKRKKNILPVIIFCITLFILIVVIIIILLK